MNRENQNRLLREWNEWQARWVGMTPGDPGEREFAARFNAHRPERHLSRARDGSGGWLWSAFHRGMQVSHSTRGVEWDEVQRYADTMQVPGWFFWDGDSGTYRHIEEGRTE